MKISTSIVRLSGSSLLFAPLLISVVGLQACHPSCKSVCKKLLECEEVETWRVSLDECEESCKREEALYESWEDYQVRDRFYDQLDCIVDEECQAVADGVCYDEELFLF